MSKFPIGLTGIIGSGKSLVANFFAQLGIDIVDTDKISHELTSSDGLAMGLIEKTFGAELLMGSGALNRTKMRQLVFSNSEAKLKLEEILHPLIFDETCKQIQVSGSIYVIVVVPLLFKSPKYQALIKRSIFVDCANEHELVRRVMLRSNLSNDEIMAIIDSHVPRNIQMKMADDIINNDANISMQEVQLQVDKLHQKYQAVFNGRLE